MYWLSYLIERKWLALYSQYILWSILIRISSLWIIHLQKHFLKNASRNITYFIYADNLCIYYNAFLCVTVSDILEIIIWNHNTCIKLWLIQGNIFSMIMSKSCIIYYIRCRIGLVIAGFKIKMSAEYVFDTSEIIK